MSELRWKDDDCFTLGDATFRTAPAQVFVERGGLKMGDADFLVAKPRPLVERYVELVDELHPERIFELGSFQGGSTALLLELARPQRLVTVDRLRMRKGLVESHASRRGLDGIVRTYGGVDQADRGRLAEIVEEEFGGRPLDLVIDDCSHEYEPSRASFNELFPRLRPGGIYVIEDWPWVAAGSNDEANGAPDQVALMRLLFEAIASIPYGTRSIPNVPNGARATTNVLIEPYAAFITRGEREVDSNDFDIAADLGVFGADLGNASDQRKDAR